MMDDGFVKKKRSRYEKGNYDNCRCRHLGRLQRLGCLCKDKTFYESLIKLLNDTEKRFQYKFDIL